MSLKKPNIILIHPGTQYTYRIASALSNADIAKKISLYTWFTLAPHSFLSEFKIFRKRVKNIDKEVQLHNFLLFELVLVAYLKFLKLFKINKGHSPRYRLQRLFGYFLLPMVYFNRKNSLLVLSETAAWPLASYAKKWGIPVVMDFPSISHEAAAQAGIQETSLGIKIKTLERQCIDYAINCSAFAAGTYTGLTSAKKHYPLWLAAEAKKNNIPAINPAKEALNICCLANTEKRKGIDLLIKAFAALSIPNKKLFLIGKISTTWIKTFCNDNQIDHQAIILTGPMAQQDLPAYLIAQQIHLHVLPSRFDSFAMVVPETMMLGIPNIVSPYVGAGEMLENGIDGYIMEDLSEVALSKCILTYMDLTQEQKQDLQEQVLKKAESMSWEGYEERVVDVFQEILTDIELI